MRRTLSVVAPMLLGFAIVPSLCAAQVTDVFRDPRMDFGSVQTIAVVPFANLTREQLAADRVRDVFINRLLATQAVYVLPVGEVARGIAQLEILNPASPTPDEVIRLGALLGADAVITGVVREYGEVRSGTTTANVISMSIQIVESGIGRVVWSASSTKGGISFWNRLIGGGGQPVNQVTEQAVDALLDKLLSQPSEER